MVFKRSKLKVHFIILLVIIVNIIKVSKSEMDGKIVGGAYAVNKQFPHAIFLDVYCSEDEWVCGSSLLNQKILLTAAHCLQSCFSNSKDKVDAFGGSEDYSAKRAIMRRVDDTLIHQNYNEETVWNDIALAIIKNSFPLNEYIKRIIIPYKFPSATKGMVAGWGLTDELRELSSSRLKFVETLLLPRIKCYVVGSIAPGMFCAGSVGNKSEHPSAGDSGSGLVIGNHRQIGIVSFRDLAYPSILVYTNVTYYYNWIIDNSRELYCG